jgi:hypothetical protein
MLSRAYLAAAVLGLALLDPVAGARAEQNTKDAIDDIAALFPAGLLRPDTLTDKLAERHFLHKDSQLAAPQWIVSAYEHEGSSEILQFSEHTFSDATNHVCFLTTQISMTFDDIVALKAKLEADHDIRKLEGEPGSRGNIRAAWFKRPGNNPSLYVNVTATDRFVTVTMSRTDFK